MMPAIPWCFPIGLVGALLTLCLAAFAAPPPWPEQSRLSRPWTYWWWHGSAIEEAELARLLPEYRAAGLGGLHVVPIYNAEGREDRAVDFLTPPWMERLAFAVREAEKHDLGLDMTTGTGWPFGGPWVRREDGAAQVQWERYRLAGGVDLATPIRSRRQPEAPLLSLLGVPESGPRLDLTDRVDTDGRLRWQPETGDWTLYAVFLGRTGQQVKRAAPGNEGLVISYFDRDVLSRYLAPFDAAFKDYRAPMPRAFYNDSYEVFGSNWSHDFFNEFHARRGYNLRVRLPEWLGDGERETVGRVRSDYQQTIDELLLEAFTRPWVDWCRAKGPITRNQAHGSPGNLLDLYATADIPETEGFGREGAHPLVARFASSAAHLAGRRLTSSETCTWMDEHFLEKLSDARREVDRLFLCGINHVFFHGTCYSPADVPWPGLMFYASTHFAPSNSWWRDLSELTGYIARCQSFLQAGEPDNDLLLYFPIWDLWHADQGPGVVLAHLTVHDTARWLEGPLPGLVASATAMLEGGYTFDFVSDRLLSEAPGERPVVLPPCRFIPHETLAALEQCVRAGGTLIVAGDWPRDVPGLNRKTERRQILQEILSRMEANLPEDGKVRTGELGRGRILAGPLPEALRLAGVRREPMAAAGLSFVRRTRGPETVYFVVNPGQAVFDGSVALSAPARGVAQYDPASGRSGRLAVQAGRVPLLLEPGESRVLVASPRAIRGDPWRELRAGGDAVEVAGPWDLTFLSGGPTLPGARSLERAALWTDLEDAELLRFSGTARYRAEFILPEGRVDDWRLRLGRVHESVAVRLNGRLLGTLIAPPYQMDLGSAARRDRNVLELDATNLMANRLTWMEREGRPWRSFFFVDINYRSFSARDWPVQPSGIAGPIELVRVRSSPRR